MNWREITSILGRLVLFFCIAFVPTMALALVYAEWGALAALGKSLLIGLLVSGVMIRAGKGASYDLFRREILLVVAMAWLIVAAIGALPFVFSGMTGTFTDAYFESMSGLTTTGSTILTDIESNPLSLLFWRAMLHFVGGLGIVVLFVAVFSQLSGKSSKALFRAEVPGPFEESSTPRIRDTALSVTKIYLLFNIAEALLLWMAGMPLFEAVCHAMATIATGGFSPKNASIYAYHSPAIEWIIIVFMFLAGTNFSLHLAMLKRKFLYFRDPEFMGYLVVTVGGAIVAAAAIWLAGVKNPEQNGVIPYVTQPGGFNVRDTLFMVFSIGTSTGFGTVDYDGWPAGIRLFLLLLMISGACAGSTSGGLKMVRWIVIVRFLPFLVQSKASPREVRRLKLAGKPVSHEQIHEIFAFSALWIGVLVALSLMVCLLSPNQPVIDSISAVAATMSNIGPGLGVVGPTDNFAAQGDLVKWLLSLGMVMGRLEIYPLLILVSPRFWLR